MGGCKVNPPFIASADYYARGEEALVKTRSLAQLSLDISAASAAEIPSGTLRVACAHFTAMHILAPVLPVFLARFP